MTGLDLAVDEELSRSFEPCLTAEKVTSCTVSNVNDTAGTGTISYTVADGSTIVIDYTLINDNGTWKIDSGKQHA